MKLIRKGEKSESKVKTVLAKEEPPKFTDLRQVMDYTRSLSMFFSGVEYESYLDILYELGIRNFLMSYEYLKGKGISQLKKYPDMSLFIDSGAYTYMNNTEYEDYTIEQWEAQIVEYLSWAKKHKDSIFAIADLDLQYLVGYEKVKEWRSKYFEPFMLETGIPVCFIYHEEGIDTWEYMCKRYPYVGFSLNVDSVSEGEFFDRFKIAEKYNTLVQGMAATKTSLLTQIPFYTVDSTTWNVGLKYGEISVWNETKMSRIKKADFETKAFPLIDRYDIPFDHNLILEEDKTELIRVNAYAFVQAEKFINERLKSRMYWKKSRTVSVDLDNLPDGFFPSVEYFDEENPQGLQEYAQKMNINPDPQGAFVLKDMIYDVTAFLNWENPEYKKMKEWYLDENNLGIIDALHDMYVNRIVPDLETKIQDLIDFFRECVSGKRDTLLQLGTNFDRIVKERSDYLSDDEEELVDLSEEELRVRLFSVLPSEEEAKDGEAREISSLDEEVFRKAEIVPVYDDRGKLMKGQTYVRKPKKIYSSKYPKVACDTCYAANKCPEFKAGYVCAYHKLLNRFDTRNMSDVIQGMQSMVDYNLARMQKAMILETINGTHDQNVSNLINQNMSLLAAMKRMYESGSAEVLRQTKVIRADGSREETTQILNPQSGGILEKLFSSNKQPTEEEISEDEEAQVKVKNARYADVESEVE